MPKPRLEENWGPWSVIAEVAKFKVESQIPDPWINNPLSFVKEEMTSTDLSDLLLELGGYLSRLDGYLGEKTAELTAYAEAYKAAIRVAGVSLDVPKGTTETAKESQLLAENELLRDTKKLAIQAEALVDIVKGWRDAYVRAWETCSRMITVRIGDISLQTGRHP